MTAPRVIILVPRREGFPDRDALWGWVRNWWQEELPELEIFEGHSEQGQFNRSCAINRASGLADWEQEKRWDLAVVIDADVICDPTRVRQGIQMAIDSQRMVMPFTVRKDLSAEGSKAIMTGYRGTWTPFVRRTYNNIVSCVNIVPRALWDAVGGYDENFNGWGFEDNAFMAACRTFMHGPELRIRGEVWHFYHATAAEGKQGTATHARNKLRADLYLKAQGNEEAITKLKSLAAPGFDHRPAGIPRILHRTIPAIPNRVAELYWEQWRALHPDWELMTHQDPLERADWPETQHLWDRCTSGAQLSGLIRLEALLRWGGIYLDHDVSPARSLEPLVPLSAFAAWEDTKCIPDAVIGAVPGHPAIRECLDLALARVAKGDGAWATGPGVTTAVFPNDARVMLLAPASFYPVHYNDPERATKMEASPAPWTYGIHRYWGSWLEPARQRVPE